MDWSNAMSAMIANQQDVHELVSRWKDMVADVPADVTFEFFDNSMYTIPNFAKMFQRYGGGEDKGSQEITASTTELTLDRKDPEYDEYPFTMETPSDFPIKSTYPLSNPNDSSEFYQINGVVIPFYSAVWTNINGQEVDAEVSQDTPYNYSGFFHGVSLYPKFGTTLIANQAEHGASYPSVHSRAISSRSGTVVPYDLTCGGNLAVKSRYSASNKIWTTDLNLAISLPSVGLGEPYWSNSVGWDTARQFGQNYNLGATKYHYGDIVRSNYGGSEFFCRCKNLNGSTRNGDAFYDWVKNGGRRWENLPDWEQWGTDYYMSHRLVVRLNKFSILLPFIETDSPIQGSVNTANDLSLLSPAISLQDNQIIGTARVMPVSSYDKPYIENIIDTASMTVPLSKHFKNYARIDVTLLSPPLITKYYQAKVEQGAPQGYAINIAVRGLTSPRGMGLFEKFPNLQ